MTRTSLLILLLLSACKGCGQAVDSGAATTIVADEPCRDTDPERQLWWGDLHVHTDLSFDAWVYDVRLDPDQAWAFAKGETVMGPPLDEAGLGTVPLRLERPLDFAALTDHAEYLAEIRGCTEAGSAIYESSTCVLYRQANTNSIQLFGISLANPNPSRSDDLCGGDFDCAAVAGDVWTQVREAATRADDPTEDCGFTAFVAYEWTGATNLSNLHRNVIFRDARVPDLPTTYFEAPSAELLWTALERDCLDAGTGCDLIVIPHNSNLSNGQMFTWEQPTAEEAARRAALEPLIEIYQHKGDSECRDDLGGAVTEPDEWCGFEKYGRDAFEDCGDSPGSGGMVGSGCASSKDFLRGILVEGLQIERQVGQNPYRLGVVASTDTHAGTPGRVEEAEYTGHLGAAEDDPSERLGEPGLVPGGYIDSPGGVVGVWAEENSRDSVFDALRRREVYGTSGPRIALRFFGGRDFDSGLCADPDLVAQADASGVPMGGQLPAGDGAPTFVVQALADPGTDGAPGMPLQRIQIVKGTVDEAGEARLTVYEVAGGDDGAIVDETTCVPSPAGQPELCALWSDPDYDPSARSFWYVRVLEDPVCRWSWRDCLALEAAGEPMPDFCADPLQPRTIQERAWSSPIWD